MVKEQLLECVMGMYGGLDSVLDDIMYIAESGDTSDGQRAIAVVYALRDKMDKRAGNYLEKNASKLNTKQTRRLMNGLLHTQARRMASRKRLSPESREKIDSWLKGDFSRFNELKYTPKEKVDPPRNYGHPPSEVAERTKGENFGKLKKQIKKEIFYK